MKRLLVSLIALLCVSVSSPASAATILQFTEAGGFNLPFVFTENAANDTTTITANKAINVVFDPNFCLVAGCGGATDGVYNLSFSATSLGAASLNAGAITQAFGGNIAITQGAINLLTVSFTDLLQGSLSGGSPTLQASQPPDIFSGTSTVIDPLKLGIPRGFALSFSNLTNGGLHITGTSIGSGTADAAGTFSATPVVPEPASMLLLGTGLVGLARYARNRRKVSP